MRGTSAATQRAALQELVHKRLRADSNRDLQEHARTQGRVRSSHARSQIRRVLGESQRAWLFVPGRFRARRLRSDVYCQDRRDGHSQAKRSHEFAQTKNAHRGEHDS